jgi:hypothetical protein
VAFQDDLAAGGGGEPYTGHSGRPTWLATSKDTLDSVPKPAAWSASARGRGSMLFRYRTHFFILFILDASECG